MRAAVFEAPGRPLQIRTVGRPEPAARQALIRVGACGICGSDLHATADEHGIAVQGGILGHEIAGTIAKLGPDPLGDWSVGDRVFCLPQVSCGRCGFCLLGRPEDCAARVAVGSLAHSEERKEFPGGYAEYLIVATSDLVRLPEVIPMDVAALVEPLAVGLMCVRDAGLQIGDRVVVFGGGPIGQAVTLWLHFFGARRIVMVEPIAFRRQLARQVGATDSFDPNSVDGLAEPLTDLLRGAPDVVIEVVGRPRMLNQTISVVRKFGRIVSGGVSMTHDQFDPVAACFKDASIRFPGTYTLRECEFIVEMIAANRINPTALISHKVTLDQLPAAFEALRTPNDQCKVVVTP